MIQSDLSFFCKVKMGGKQTMYRGHGGGGWRIIKGHGQYYKNI